MSKLIASTLEEGSSLNMMREEQKLLEAPPDHPYLHTYLMDNSSITYGHFVKPEKWICLSCALQGGISLAKRPTGGGLLFHGHDFAFSLSVPSTHSLFKEEPLNRYLLINKIVVSALQEAFSDLNFLLLAEKESSLSFEKEVCLAHITIYDLQINGKKVGGSAQRKTKNSLLHQGYLHLFPINKTPYEKALITPSLWDSIDLFSAPLFPYLTEEKRKKTATLIRHQLIKSFSNAL